MVSPSAGSGQALSNHELTLFIKREARMVGFDVVGVASAAPHPDYSFFEKWIAAGKAGTMDWLSRGSEKRGEPSKILPGVRSIICCGLSYYRGHPRSIEKIFPSPSMSKQETSAGRQKANCALFPDARSATELAEGQGEGGTGWISNYAWGEDYHQVVLKKLERLEDLIRREVPSAQFKSYVDTGPILERSYAASAGLGWIGKNTSLINTKVGSFFFIGEILTDLELEFDRPDTDHCGTCTRCLEACPTQALQPYEMDATRCISYLTIEHRGPVDAALAEKMGQHLVGCDICQDVCPWNHDIPLSREEAFDPRPGNFNPPLESMALLTSGEFAEIFRGSAIKRVKWEGLMRNLGVALKNCDGFLNSEKLKVPSAK